MVEQMKLALTIEYTVQTLSDSKDVVISYKDCSHSVSPETGTCSYTFQQTLLMPSRHIFRYCDHLGSPMFDTSMVTNRWLKSYQVHVSDTSCPSYDDAFHASNEICYTSISSATKLGKTLSQSQKYRIIHSLTDKLTFCALQCGMGEFREKYATLEMVLYLWEKNNAFTVVPATDCTSTIKEEKCPVLSSDPDVNDLTSADIPVDDPKDDFDSAPDDSIPGVNSIVTAADNVNNHATDVDPIVDNPSKISHTCLMNLFMLVAQ